MSGAVQCVELQWGDSSVRIEYQWINAHHTCAPLMVFLHEGLGCVSLWRDFPQHLCEQLGWRGLVYSRPGYGQSTPRDASQRWLPDFMHRQAQEVLPALLRQLSVQPEEQRVWLFGHSDGASIALLHAAHHPHYLGGLIVLAPHTLVEEVSLRSIAAARTAYLQTDLRQRLAKHHADPDSAFWGWNDVWLSPAFRDWNITQELGTISCPVLAVQGADDAYGSMEQIRGIARVVPQTTLLELADCGHAPHLEQRDRLTAAVCNFIAQGQR